MRSLRIRPADTLTTPFTTRPAPNPPAQSPTQGEPEGAARQPATDVDATRRAWLQAGATMLARVSTLIATLPSPLQTSLAARLASCKALWPVPDATPSPCHADHIAIASQRPTDQARQRAHTGGAAVAAAGPLCEALDEMVELVSAAYVRNEVGAGTARALLAVCGTLLLLAAAVLALTLGEQLPWLAACGSLAVLGASSVGTAGCLQWQARRRRRDLNEIHMLLDSLASTARSAGKAARLPFANEAKSRTPAATPSTPIAPPSAGKPVGISATVPPPTPEAATISDTSQKLVEPPLTVTNERHTLQTGTVSDSFPDLLADILEVVCAHLEPIDIISLLQLKKTALGLLPHEERSTGRARAREARLVRIISLQIGKVTCTAAVRPVLELIKVTRTRTTIAAATHARLFGEVCGKMTFGEAADSGVISESKATGYTALSFFNSTWRETILELFHFMPTGKELREEVANSLSNALNGDRRRSIRLKQLFFHDALLSFIVWCDDLPSLLGDPETTTRTIKIYFDENFGDKKNDSDDAIAFPGSESFLPKKERSTNRFERFLDVLDDIAYESFCWSNFMKTNRRVADYRAYRDRQGPDPRHTWTWDSA